MVRLRSWPSYWPPVVPAVLIFAASLPGTVLRQAPPLAPVVDVVSVNPGIRVEKSLCLTIALSEDAAAECGDLRIVHPLPTTRTMNQARTPALLYNGGLAHPFPRVHAIVTLPATSTVPDSITGTLTIGGVAVARGKWNGAEWAPGKARYVTLAFDGLTRATGFYSYTLEMRTWFGATSLPVSTTGSLAVVNRSASGFRPGWWLAGLEALDVATKVWVGGDGSIRQYTPATGMTNVWVAGSVTYRDTLKLIGNQYVRFDQDSVQVVFDNTGKHIQTRNRQKHVTGFAYTAAGLLQFVFLPPASAKFYQFFYTAGQLDSVRASGLTASTWRKTTLTKTGNDLFIRDPDGSSVQYRYTTSAGSENIITVRWDRRGTPVNFDRGPTLKVVQGRIGSGEIITLTTHLQEKGLPTSGSVDTALAFTRVNGPRKTPVSDTTLYWLDAIGAVRKIMDAKGNITTLTRSDSRFPGLVTHLRRASGQLLVATYDNMGRIRFLVDSSTTNGTVYATTRYLWDDKWDGVTSIVLPEGFGMTMSHAPTTGNRLWQQDSRGSPSRVNFTYNLQNQVTQVTRPGTAAETFTYDALGNLASVKTPKGYTTFYRKDALGRDTLIDSPIDTTASSTRRHLQRIKYDIANRETEVFSIGPSMGAGIPAETLYVRKAYNESGQLDSLTRRCFPDPAGIGISLTRWAYDFVGRPVKEIAPDGRADSTEYDEAGNVIARIPRRGAALKVTMTYDETNRLTRRTIPAVSYPPLPSAIDGSAIGRPNKTYAAHTVPGDVQNFEYDEVGNLIRADNAHARIRRTYYQNGLLETDSLYINTAAGTDFTKHKYLTVHRYDLNGRRTALTFPEQFRPPTMVSSLTYTYEPVIGTLASVTDPQFKRYDLTYTNRTELKTLTWPGQYRQEYTYDADGRTVGDTIRNLGGTAPPRIFLSPVRSMRLSYDGRERKLFSHDPTALKDRLTASSSGLGYLVGSTFRQEGKYNGDPGAVYEVTESFKYDGLGNRHYSDSRITLDAQDRSMATFTNRFATFFAQTGRLKDETPNAGVISYTYDFDGNMEFVQQAGDPPDERRSYYAADGKLARVVARNAHSTHVLLGYYRETVDVHRYDALGRRVWLKSDKDCRDNTLPFDDAYTCQISVIRRTVWDLDQELAEIQMPGDSTAGELPYWENDTNPVLLPAFTAGGSTADKNPFYGRVLYTHGAGLDRPLAIYRIGYSFATDTTWTAVTPQEFGRFSLHPFWSLQGEAVLGSFETGSGFNCKPVGTRTACVIIQWPFVWSAYDRERGMARRSWHGSLLESRRDGSGLQYRRNRFYDPAAGRFTQEDPIGLAGGINLYGYGNGDPVNYSDPFGLLATCDPPDSPKCKDALQRPLIGEDLIVAVGGLLVGAGRVAFGALTRRAASSGTATFYRGVSQGEAADIVATGGKLRAGAAASGNTGKYLTNSAPAATRWGAQNGPGSQVVKITVPADATKAFTSLGRMDGIGEAWWAPMDALEGAKVEFVEQLLRQMAP